MDPATIGIILGAASTGINIMGGNRQANAERRQREAQKRTGHRKYQEDLAEMAFKAQDVNRSADEAIDASDESANERGIYDSSIRTDATNKINDERNRRLAAMERQKGYMTADLKDNDYMYGLQNRMIEAQKWMQVAQGISGGLTSVDWSKV